mgnify:CR=1 FL=1
MGMKTYCGYTHDDMNRVLDFMCNIEDQMELDDKQVNDFDVAIQCIATVMNRMVDDRPIEWD